MCFQWNARPYLQISCNHLGQAGPPDAFGRSYRPAVAADPELSHKGFHQFYVRVSYGFNNGSCGELVSRVSAFIGGFHKVKDAAQTPSEPGSGYAIINSQSL